MKIKVCGIRDPRTAAETIRLGADMIGIICCPHSRRYVDEQTACAITKAAKKAGGCVVVVFVDLDAKEMQQAMDKIGADIIQLHGDIARQQFKYLSPEISKIFTVPVNVTGQPVIEMMSFLPLLNPQRDYVLFDNIKPGSGRSYSYAKLPSTKKVPIIIAGGVNANNVADILKNTLASAVDVSSGVENEYGDKDLKKIAAFIAAVRK